VLALRVLLVLALRALQGPLALPALRALPGLRALWVLQVLVLRVQRV
jgi:hypothetical protein